MLYNISTITAILGGRSSGPLNRNVQHLITDSRKLIEPGSSLFISLIGDKRDGHAYIPDLIRRGVKAFIVSHLPAQIEHDVSYILVPDTLAALQQLAAHHRLQFQYPVVGLTGSNGKTIVKEWLHFLLHEQLRIVRSPRSYNSQIGVPLSVWQMDKEAELGIFEAGISQKGEMQKLAEIIQPTIGIFTNIGEAHSEGFPSTEEKIREKLILFHKTDVLIYCADYETLDKEVKQLQTKTALKCLSWSRYSNATFQIEERRSNSSTEINIHSEASDYTFSIPFMDSAATENAIHCAILLIHLGYSSLIQQRMPMLPSLSMRMEMKSGINRCTLINDSYSTDIRSLKLALDFMQQQGRLQKQTVILSDIPETGKEEDVLYEQVAQLLDQYSIDRLIGIGPAFVRQAGRWSERNASFWVSTKAFLDQLTLSSFKDEKVLIKGARKFSFEQIQRALEDRHHQTIMTVNLSAIAHNLTHYRKRISAGTKVMAMVKAFSYGSGTHEIANVLQYHQVDYLAVAYADEGMELRQAGISLPIMVMNPDQHSFDQLVDYDLQPEIYSFEIFDQFKKYLEAEGIKDFPIHIKVDTGMHRLGFDPEEISRLAEAIKISATYRVVSVFTHLAGSESAEDDSFTQLQQARFENASKILRQELGYDFIKHISNTAAVLRHPELQYDMIRLGIGLYGVDLTSPVSSLREAATLSTTIAQIKKLGKEETVGYNRKGKLTRDSLIATIRIGYADGYPRALGSGKGQVMIKGRLFPVIGSVCMDMTMIDITDDPTITLHDEVILFGAGLPVQEVAARANTIAYDIMTGISARVKRVYIED